jgi:peptide/nickel transport system substrate-binding protein
MEGKGSDRLGRSAMTRRRFLEIGAGAMGALGLTGALAACGGGDEGEAEAPPSGTTATTEPGATTATTGEPTRGGTVKLAISDALSSDTLDPNTNISVFGLSAMNMIYDHLVRLDNDWNVSPALAEDWDVNPEATEWTFKLKSGVEFHSGKTLTADDVAYTISRNLDEKTGGGAFGLWSPVLAPQGIAVVDPQTIKFTLKIPDAFFLIKLGHFYGYIYEDGTDFSTSPGTGPFKSERFKGGEAFELVRNENYWMDGLPHLDGVTAVVIPEVAAKTQSVISGDVHMIDAVDWSATPQLESAENLQILQGPFYAAFVFGIDGTAAPYDDANVRKAMKMLLDRPRFVEVATLGHGTPSADSAVHPNDPFYPADLEPFPFDPEQAKALLAAAGYPDGFDETIYTSDCCPAMLDAAVLLKDALAAGGINAEVANRTFDELFTKNWLTDRLVTNYWLRQHPSTMLAFMYASEGPWNESRLKDPEIDQWLNEAQSTTDEAKQKELIGEVLRKYNDEASSLWPFHMDAFYAHKSELEGVEVHPVSLWEFRNAQLTS